jgi:hypothetical protein
VYVDVMVAVLVKVGGTFVAVEVNVGEDVAVNVAVLGAVGGMFVAVGILVFGILVGGSTGGGADVGGHGIGPPAASTHPAWASTIPHGMIARIKMPRLNKIRMIRGFNMLPFKLLRVDPPA